MLTKYATNTTARIISSFSIKNLQNKLLHVLIKSLIEEYLWHVLYVHVMYFQGLRKNLLRRGPGNSLQLLTMPFSVLRENVEEEVHELCNLKDCRSYMSHYSVTFPW